MCEVDFSAMLIYFMFPDRQDRRLFIMDNCPQAGSCPGHPQGTHAGGTTLDTGYYTHKTNRTQPGGVSNIEITQIWDGGNLLADAFDWERNFLFLRDLYRAFPDSSMIVHQTIKNYMMRMIKEKYGDQEWVDFSQHVRGDTVPQYQHDKHIHVKLF